MTRDDPPPVSGGSYADRRFVGVRLTGELHGATFRDCVFEECDLREVKLHACAFVDSDLLTCDLGLLDVTGSRFRGVTLEACHVVGVEWTRAFTDTQWRVDVDAKVCVLNFCSYVGLDLRRRRFEACTIHEALFDGCDLRDASFRHSDLSGTQVERCDLRGADLRTARHYAIAPGRNRVEGLRASLPEAAGLLTGLGIELD